jgi:predicted DNA-binding protein
MSTTTSAYTPLILPSIRSVFSAEILDEAMLPAPTLAIPQVSTSIPTTIRDAYRKAIEDIKDRNHEHVALERVKQSLKALGEILPVAEASVQRSRQLIAANYAYRHNLVKFCPDESLQKLKQIASVLIGEIEKHMDEMNRHHYLVLFHLRRVKNGDVGHVVPRLQYFQKYVSLTGESLALHAELEYIIAY